LEALSRFPLQPFVPNPGTKGFTLQPGLKGNILPFCHHSIKEKAEKIQFRFLTI
jgi:hypothetical protein